MKKVNYKVGDIVELADGVQYVYRGKKRKAGYAPGARSISAASRACVLGAGCA